MNGEDGGKNWTHNSKEGRKRGGEISIKKRVWERERGEKFPSLKWSSGSSLLGHPESSIQAHLNPHLGRPSDTLWQSHLAPSHPDPKHACMITPTMFLLQSLDIFLIWTLGIHDLFLQIVAWEVFREKQPSCPFMLQYGTTSFRGNHGKPVIAHDLPSS